MNCRRRGKAARSKQVDKNPSKEGNGVAKSDGKKGMEYKPVTPVKRPKGPTYINDWNS